MGPWAAHRPSSSPVAEFFVIVADREGPQIRRVYVSFSSDTLLIFLVTDYRS